MSEAACPRCGAAASGKFCSECGASLAPATCPACGQTTAAGARFCNRCGASLTGQPAAGGVGVAGSSRADSQVAWWIAGGTLVVMIVMLAWPVINPEQPVQQ